MPEEPANAALLDKINELYRMLGGLIRRQVELKLDFDRENDRLKGIFDKANAELEDNVTSTKDELKELIIGNRAELIGSKLKSFATEFAKFSFRDVTTKFKVTDKNDALAQAKRLGIMRKVCTMKVVYSVDPAMLKAYLDSHPEHFELFTDSIEQAAVRESLSAKSNETFHTRHDTERLTNKAITLS